MSKLDDGRIKKTTVYIPWWLHGTIKTLAKDSRRSFNSEILYALEKHVNAVRDFNPPVAPRSKE